ncbi:MAG TPA: ADOP family duplicated permease [Gemmatimonadaceae bacterium]|nr:ADOP family duplicated permease [Gemmatimonadaceae bacterium]
MRTQSTSASGDLRLALRSLRRSPTFTTATIAILALGIGMSTAMFTIYKTVLIDRLPVIAQDRLVVMHPVDRRGTHLDVPYPYLAEMARDSAVFRGVGGVYHLGAQSSPYAVDGSSIRLNTASASPNYFAVFGMRPAIGRLFRLEDGGAGAPVVMVLSYATWQKGFGADPNAIGRTLIAPYTEQRVRIVGVAPPGFEFPTDAEAWVQLAPDFTAQVDIVARLAPGVGIDAARGALFAMTQRSNPFVLEAPHKPIPIDGVEAKPFTDMVLGNSRPALVALTLAVALLLVIACINVGSLVLVRLMSRHREIAVRRAIGASYGDVVRLFATENAILGIAGGVVGFVTAFVVLHVVSAAAPASLPRADALGAARAPLGAAAAISLFTLLAFGVLPSLMASRVSSYAALRSDSRTGSEGRYRRRIRRWLVASQMALAVVMLTGAALLVRTLTNLQSMDLGYRPGHLALLSFTGPKSVLATNQQIFDAARVVLARVEATPGVIAATPIESAPFKGQSFFIMPLAPAAEPASERARRPFLPFEFVGPDYFRTFDIRIRRGRGFAPADTRSSDKVVVLSESFARRLWPNEDAVGKQLVNANAPDVWTVVGIASDTHLRELKNTGPVAYFDWEQVQPFWNGLIAVRTRNSLGAMLPALRAATHDANPNLVLFDAQTMDGLLDAPLAQPRLSAWLLTGFSIAALLLSAIGLYGVMASAVRQQTRDIGVRVALGATPRDVRHLVLGDAIRVVGAGGAVGLAASLVAGRLLASQLFDVSPIDPVSLAAATGSLVVIGISAAYLPARRATRIDPVHALRAE